MPSARVTLPPSSNATCSRDQLRLLDRIASVARVFDQEGPQAGAVQSAGGDGLILALRQAVQLAPVADLANELADIRVHAAAHVDEQPSVGRHGSLLAEQVPECGYPGFLGMPSLGDLRQLLRISEQHEVGGRCANGKGVGQ